MFLLFFPLKILYDTGKLLKLTTAVSHILPVSDDGGSTAEIVRVLGGPAVGDIRSRCLRLADDSDAEVCFSMLWMLYSISSICTLFHSITIPCLSQNKSVDSIMLAPYCVA